MEFVLFVFSVKLIQFHNKYSHTDVSCFMTLHKNIMCMCMLYRLAKIYFSTYSER